MVVGSSRCLLWICGIRPTLPHISGILVTKRKEVKNMWWPGFGRGRGRCWWYLHSLYFPYLQAPQQPLQPSQPLLAAPYLPVPPFVSPPTLEQEIEALEAYKADLEEELRGVEARIKELRESMTKRE
ncbi:MAG: DUF5320 domain-containing protein [Hadesarchaea archaeon]|nr:DUF5320 domain-containing protein [Hadesarchaea archaeon]